MYYGRMQTRTEGLRRHEPLAAFGVELHALGICVTPQTGVLYNFNPGAGEGVFRRHSNGSSSFHTAIDAVFACGVLVLR